MFRSLAKKYQGILALVRFLIQQAHRPAQRDSSANEVAGIEFVHSGPAT